MLEDHAGRFVRALEPGAAGLPPREAALLARVAAAPGPLGPVLRGRSDLAALDALVSRGLVQVAGVTPSDAAHVLGKLTAWDIGAADKALRLMARRRDGAGRAVAADARALAAMIEAQLVRQTVDCLLEAALAEDGAAAAGWGGLAPEALAAHPLLAAALAGHSGALRLSAGLGVPVVGLGASAPAWYPAVGQASGTPRMVLPAHADVANAVGAVVGQIAMRARGTVTSPAEGRYTAHLPTGPQGFADRDAALAALAAALEAEARARAAEAGAGAVQIDCDTVLREAAIEGRTLFIEAEVTVTATGRPRVARG
jgi:N-methylhydantoinase A/oxoprolinase/acetone carboxylase beta subunit